MNFKKIILFFGFLLSINIAFPQVDSTEIKLQKIAAEKDDNARIDLINDILSEVGETDPNLDMQFAQKLFFQSKKNNDMISEAIALGVIGYCYRSFGNTQKSIEYNLRSKAVAQASGNEKLIANTVYNLAHNYKDQADYPRAIKMYMLALESGIKLNDYMLQVWGSENLSQVYLEMNKIDSALKYAQRSYELSMQIHFYDDLSYIFKNLGSIQGKMGNSSLAIDYFNMAIQEGYKRNSVKQLNWAFTAIAQYYHYINQNDSSMLYAKKAINIVQNTEYSSYCIKPAKLLLDIYRNSNIDSAFKYSEMYRIANDSTFSIRAIQQTQSATFEDDMHQRELEAEKIKEEEQRSQNIQYALIAIGIITFIVLFLSLSRSFITSAKVIEFLGVIALLIVFEFFNLLLHPFLERITNHTPLLMLLGLVCIAAVIIPLHHRIEKWSTAKLVEKNKMIRLAKAKKTIEQLEEKTEK